MKFICQNPTCAIAISKAAFPAAMNCPVCAQALVELVESNELSAEDENLIASLPYVIAYPLKETLLQNDYEKRLHRLGYTFINFLKYLGLISISEFFNSNFKNRRIVDLFLSQLSEKPSTGKWNGFIRDCNAILEKEKIKLVFPEFYDFYIQIEHKDKKFNISEEIIEDFGELNYSKKNGLSSIGMLINFRNKYLGHGTPINENQAKELWAFYYPIFQTLLVKLQNLSELSLYKKENGIVWKLASSVVSEENNLNQAIDEEKVWLADNKDRKLSMVPFFINPSDFGDIKNETQLLVYESYTGSTIKFFSPESIVKETSGAILQRLNLLLREKQKETPFAPEAFTKDEFLKRIVEENKLLLDTLIAEKKIIPGIYQHREEIEIKLREWIGARASIFFIVAEAGSGKTNLLVEIQKQYTDRQLPSLLIRAGRMEKQSLKQQINYLLNIDFEKGLENYISVAGNQAEPTFILIDGLNEANNAEEIWREIIDLSKVFEPGSLKFVVTNRANTKAELNRYLISEKDQDLLFGENKDNETGLSAYSFWLTALDMKEMKGAWENYATKDKAKFKPQFNFDAIAEFDRGLYNQINNPLILRLFLEIYNGKALPKKGVKHLNIWHDWLKTFSTEEQIFLKLLANEVWLKGENELLLDDLLKRETLKPYFTSDIIIAPYNRLKSKGWISRYTKELNACIAFTVEGALLYLLGQSLQNAEDKVDLAFIDAILKDKSKLHKGGIEAYLAERALAEDINLITELIDSGEEGIDLCINPLLLYLKSYGSQKLIEQILENPTENDWKALLKLDEQLEELQLYVIRKDFLSELMPLNKFDYKNAILIGLKAISIFEKEEATNYLSKIKLNKTIVQEDAEFLFQIGRCELQYGNYDTSLGYFQQFIDRKIIINDSDILDISNSLINIGLAWKFKGDFEKSIEYYLKCLDIRIKYLSIDHPLIASVYSNIGNIYTIKSELEKALEYHNKSIEILNKHLGNEHPHVSNSYINIAIIWRRKGEYSKALEIYKNSFNNLLKFKGPDNLDIARLYNNIGNTLYDMGEFENAIENYFKSLEIELKNLGKEHPNIARLYYNIGNTYMKLKDSKNAIIYLNKSLVIRLLKLSPGHPDIISTYYEIGQAFMTNSDYKNALDNLNSGLNATMDGRFYFDIAKCHELMKNNYAAFTNYIKYAEFMKNDLKANTKKTRYYQSIDNVIQLATEFNKMDEVPEWIRKFEK